MKQKILLLMIALFNFAGGAKAILSFTKDIVGYECGEGRYYLIASPIGEVEPKDVSNMCANAFDLYSFDPEAEKEWRNHKAGAWTHLEPGKGYLYANSEDVTLTFTGAPYDGAGTIDVHEGWNLLGNPFIENVYLVDGEGKALTYYVMNEQGDGLVNASEENSMRLISPMEGFFYYASEEGTVRLVIETPEEVSGEGIALNIDIVLPESHDLNDNQNGIEEEEEPEPTTPTQTIALTTGWNWVSFYVEITLDDLKNALVAAVPFTEITIKSQSNGSIKCNRNRWSGLLNSLNLSQMYRIKVASPCEITLEGEPINPAEQIVTIKQGDNWIGFPLNESMTVTNAFAGFAISGDVIRSKTEFAVYTGTRWRGTLQYLTPGQGYVYESPTNDDRTFVFPSY